MRCPTCHASADVEAWFCKQCGAQLISDEELEARRAAADLDEDSSSFESENTDTITFTMSEDARSLVKRELQLEVIEGPDRGLKIRVANGRALIGTDASADLRVSDPTVSRRHAEIRTISVGVLLDDLASKNGSRIDGAVVRRALLPEHGEFGVGPRTRIRATSQLAQVAPIELSTAFDPYVTGCEALRTGLQLLNRVASSTATVLLQGETGTGKDLLARAVHQASDRRAQPFVVVDCGAAAPSLLESQLFGHRRGAFTTAIDDQIGAFEHADHGTIFLDEIGELPLELQPKLLRALEARVIRRLGEVEDRAIDVRFIAATNRDLTAMVADQLFRRDLYYRLAVIRVTIPPLRERPEDVPLLANRFMAELSKNRARLDPATYSTLAQYHWPGNARELRNILERALAVTAADRIRPEDLFLDEEKPASTFSEAKERLITSFEKRYAEALLSRHDGNVSKAAKEAGLSRPALYALLKRAGLEIN